MGIGIVIYILLAIGVTYLSIFYIEFSMMQILGIVLLIPIFMKIILSFLKKRITVSVESKNPIYEMKTLQESAQIIMNIKIKNKSKILPLSKGVVFLEYKNLFSGEKGHKKLYFFVNAKQKTKKKYNIEIRHCGSVEVKVKKIKIYDYLSIFSAKIKNNTMIETAVVLPPLKEIIEKETMWNNESTQSSNRYSPYRQGDDSSEVFGVRDYKEGDKLQQIHWKLTYKKRSLMVKEYSLPLTEEINIFIDFFVEMKERHPLRKIDRLMQDVYSYAMAFIEMEIPTKMIWYDNIDGMIKTQTVSREDELTWVFREIFQNRITHDKEELSKASIEWGLGRPTDSGLYITSKNR